MTGLLRRAAMALAAGVVALTVNIAVLDTFDALGIVTARGGLQTLARSWLGGPLAESSIPAIWTALALPDPDSAPFKTGFKVGVGLLMALCYAMLLEPRPGGSARRRGLLAAVPFWFPNAFGVLPSLGDGIAGMRVLTPLGALAYAGAHTAFFVVLATTDAALRRGQPAFLRGDPPNGGRRQMPNHFGFVKD